MTPTTLVRAGGTCVTQLMFMNVPSVVDFHLAVSDTSCAVTLICRQLLSLELQFSCCQNMHVIWGDVLQASDLWIYQINIGLVRTYVGLFKSTALPRV